MARRESQLTMRTVAVWLGVFVLAALALRIGGNVGASYDEETGRYLYSGNDPYYHDRVVDHILVTGESMIWDDGINYPDGGPNPNPPLYDWTTALDAKFLEMAGVGDPVGLALNIAVAFWGAITVIPVFMIGADLFGRRAGLWAAFFMAVSAPHIQRGVFGFADHDATTMFWIVLALAFAIKGLKALDTREYVKDWRHPAAFKEGLGNAFRHNKEAMLWSALSGVALTATALTWKGYPYVLAILAVAVGLQLLADHTRNKDSTALWAFYLLPLVMVTLLPMVYYQAFPSFQDTTIWAGIYVLLGVVIVGLILVPTRDLPSIIVFPALAVAGLVGLALMLWVFPNVGQTVFTGLGYFEQTKLYTTIAEAQRSELGRVAASFGFFTFLLAFGGLWQAFRRAWKGEAAMMLMFSWAIVALFMAFAASRFVMNAAPVFAILAAALMPGLTAWIKLDDVRKRFRQQHGQNQVKAGFRSLNGRAVGGALLVFGLFVLPNAWIGVDAALPCEVDDCLDRNTKHLGAFGIDFDVKRNGWLEAFHALSALDQDMPLEDRPGFIAWWDYGHWATSLGKHPTVADPFQNHYAVAGRFLAAETEQAGAAWMAIIILNADYHRDDREAYSPAVAAVLESTDARLLEIGPMRGYDREIQVMRDVFDFTQEEVFEFYDDVVDASGKEIGYFAVDRRMYPFDAEQAPGIFYAPAFLANKNPDDFLQYQYVGQGLTLNVKQYGVDKDGNSYRLPVSVIENSAGRKYDVYPTGAGAYEAVPTGTPITATSQGTPVQFRLQPTERFYDSMYARAFGHSQNGFVPGDGLAHWRVIHQSEGQAVELLEYFRGVRVSGTVRDDGGNGMEGVTVTFRDGFGARHHAATTGPGGEFTVIAPFSIDDGDLTLEVLGPNGGVLANSTAYQFTREQAEFRHSVTGVVLEVQRGDVSGRVYWDRDRNGAYNEDNDTLVQGAQVTLRGTTITAGTGTFSFPNEQPGSLRLTVAADGFQNATRSITLTPGGEASADIALTPQSSSVTFTLGDNNEDFPQIPFTVTGEGVTRQLTSNAEGQATTTLAPGTYQISLNYQVSQDGQQVTYTANWTGVVPFGGDARAFDVFVTKSTA